MRCGASGWGVREWRSQGGCPSLCHGVVIPYKGQGGGRGAWRGLGGGRIPAGCRVRPAAKRRAEPLCMGIVSSSLSATAYSSVLYNRCPASVAAGATGALVALRCRPVPDRHRGRTSLALLRRACLNPMIGGRAGGLGVGAPAGNNSGTRAGCRSALFRTHAATALAHRQQVRPGFTCKCQVPVCNAGRARLVRMHMCCRGSSRAQVLVQGCRQSNDSFGRQRVLPAHSNPPRAGVLDPPCKHCKHSCL